MSPAVPVPVIAGVVMRVRSSPKAPVSLAGVRVNAIGAAEAVVSMVTTSGADDTETLPAGSVSLAVSVCAPSARVVVVTDQVPPVPTTALPTAVGPSYRVTVSPAVAVPVIAGVVMRVRSSPKAPVSLAGVRVNAIGAAEAVVSMVTTSGADDTETLPAGSVSVAVSVCGPSARVAVLTDQVPPVPTTALPTAVVPRHTGSRYRPR